MVENKLTYWGYFHHVYLPIGCQSAEANGDWIRCLSGLPCLASRVYIISPLDKAILSLANFIHLNGASKWAQWCIDRIDLGDLGHYFKLFVNLGMFAVTNYQWWKLRFYLYFSIFILHLYK